MVVLGLVFGLSDSEAGTFLSHWLSLVERLFYSHISVISKISTPKFS